MIIIYNDDNFATGFTTITILVNNRIGPNDQQQIDVDTEKKVEMRNIKRRQQNLLTDHLRVHPVASELPDPQI